MESEALTVVSDNHHENQRISVYVHVNRLKRYPESEDHPIGIPMDDEPYLSRRDLPDEFQ